MQSSPKVNTYFIGVGENVKTIKDKKSKSRVANFPFEFPDGTRGVMIVVRIKDEDWKPSKSIENIGISFK